MSKVFLGGTCGKSTWRDALIPALTIDYFNPVVPNWTPECQEEERRQRERCDFLLYTITSDMVGVYSINGAIEVTTSDSDQAEIHILQRQPDRLRAQFRGLAHVDDIAAGLVLILDKGEIGECYILTEANHSMGDIVGTVAKVAGKKAPKRNMPTGLLKMLRPVGPLVGKLMKQPPNLAELISSADNVTFWADASKARNQLGFRPRDLETGMRETIEAEGWLN